MKHAIIRGFLAGILFVSFGYGTNILVWVSSLDFDFLVTIAVFVINLMTGIILAGKTYHEMLTAWALSITSGIITFLIYAYSGFLGKCYSFIFSEYETDSIGNSFMVTVIFICLFLGFILAAVTAVGLTAFQKRIAKKGRKKIDNRKDIIL